MNYQLLHGEDCAKYWQAETEREEYLLKEATDLLREIVDKVSYYI